MFFPRKSTEVKKKNDRYQVIQFMTFSSPGWRSKSANRKGLKYPKKVTRNCQVNVGTLLFLTKTKTDQRSGKQKTSMLEKNTSILRRQCCFFHFWLDHRSSIQRPPANLSCSDDLQDKYPAPSCLMSQGGRVSVGNPKMKYLPNRYHLSIGRTRSLGSG